MYVRRLQTWGTHLTAVARGALWNAMRKPTGPPTGTATADMPPAGDLGQVAPRGMDPQEGRAFSWRHRGVGVPAQGQRVDPWDMQAPMVTSVTVAIALHTHLGTATRVTTTGRVHPLSMGIVGVGHRVIAPRMPARVDRGRSNEPCAYCAPYLRLGMPRLPALWCWR